MTLAELDEHIKTFKRRVNDPQLSEAQRAAFQVALEGAEKQRQELLAAQAPAVPPKAERTILKSPVDTQLGALPITPPVIVEPDPAAHGRGRIARDILVGIRRGHGLRSIGIQECCF